MQIVLLGEVGSGKTTLFNRITESDEKTSSSVTTTINVTSKLSVYGSCKFNVLDTPGFCTSQRKIVHAAGIITALTECPVNRIIVTIRFGRIDKIVQQFCDVLKHIDTYKHLTTVAVTSWDLSYNSEREGLEKELGEIFQRKFNQTSIIFTSDKESGNEICEKIIQEIANSKAEQIIITPEMVFQKFLVLPVDEDDELEQMLLEEDFFSMVRGKIRKYENLKKKSLTSNINIDVLAEVILQIKQELIILLEEFEINNKRIFFKLEFLHKVMIHERLKKIIQENLKHLISYIEKGENELNKLIGSEKIQCEFETTQLWKDQVEKSKEQYWLKIQEEIVKQKQNRKRL